jgi:ATP-binding cassette subfamily C protein CydCD
VLADQPILVLDEPTAHLDHGTAARVAEEFLGAPGRGGGDRTIVWITHGTVGLDHLDRVLNLSDHAAPEAAESEVRPSSDQAVDLTLR